MSICRSCSRPRSMRASRRPVAQVADRGRSRSPAGDPTTTRRPSPRNRVCDLCSGGCPARARAGAAVRATLPRQARACFCSRERPVAGRAVRAPAEAVPPHGAVVARARPHLPAVHEPVAAGAVDLDSRPGDGQVAPPAPDPLVRREALGVDLGRAHPGATAELARPGHPAPAARHSFLRPIHNAFIRKSTAGARRAQRPAASEPCRALDLA